MGPLILRTLSRLFCIGTAHASRRAAGTSKVPPQLAHHHTSPPPPHVAEFMQAVWQFGAVHPKAMEIAMRALSFGRLRLVDVMVPRNRVCAISDHASFETVCHILLEDGHSRMPVYHGTLDKIVGILVAKDVLALTCKRSPFALHEVLQPPYFCPETMNAVDLLQELQRRSLHFAVVVDELGGTAGIITLKDLIEELVGNIYGPHDQELPELVHLEPDGAVTVQGMMPVRDANRQLHLGLPESEAWSTVGGLCVNLAGRIPEKGSKLACENGTTLEVVDASPRSVRVVRLRRQLGAETALLA